MYGAARRPGTDKTGRALARAERGPAPSAPELETAEHDLLVERADLGPGAHTLVAAGDPVPPELAGLPRKPRTAKAKGG